MTDLIVDSMKAVKGKMTVHKNTFELLGYDFIIDEQLNTIIIEVNTNPCLEESNQLLKHMLPRMLDDMFNITMDPLFYGKESAAQTLDNNTTTPNNRPKNYKSNFPIKGDIFMVD